jgi:uncharacterized protein
MEKPDNPFVIQGYFGSDYFCDRKSENELVSTSLKNGVNVVLISPRRIGKSALIHHCFHGLKGKTIFVDLWSVQNMSELVERFATAIFSQYKKPSLSMLKSLGNLFKSLQVSLGVDPIAGTPELSFEINPKHGPAPALADLFAFLNSEKQQFYIALDEFQQITAFPENNAEALLREHIQRSKNVHFIFSGSHQGMMTMMFSNPKRPFFQSATPLHLGKIAPTTYSAFIIKQFKKHKKTIDKEFTYELLDWCRNHTYYIQYFCNRLFSRGGKVMTPEDLKAVKHAILKEREPEYALFRNILGRQHWQLLIAIACEEPAQKITSGAFISKYQLSAASTVSQNLKSLIDKQLIEYEDDGYILSDVFFSRWLRYYQTGDI